VSCSITLPGMQTDPAYELLRQFASPIVAITSRWHGRTNGMISDSAVRASISPKVPRLSVSIHKWHLSHDLIWQSGLLAIHLLHRNQLQLVHQLGFVSGRDGDKLARVPHFKGKLGLPILEDRVAAFEMRVINTMDAGYATHFLGDVEAVHPGKNEEVLAPPWFRDHMPPAWTEEWRANYRKAQDVIEQHSAIEDRPWTGPSRS
jgi:flavin reductase (DIM6/NTAB) family NADH-FMN oxidoreductase RutF